MPGMTRTEQATEPREIDDGPPLQTFLFADLAGFTAFTEAHGDQQAADLIGSFTAAVRDLLDEHNAEEVKAIRDAVMIRAPQAADAVRLGLRIVRDVGGRHRFPAVRVGLSTGPAVARDDDWFGASVNLAARVSRAAAAGEVLLTDATKRAAGKELEGITLVYQERAAVQERRPTGRPLDRRPPRGGKAGGSARDRPGLPHGGNTGARCRDPPPPRPRALLLLTRVCPGVSRGPRPSCQPVHEPRGAAGLRRVPRVRRSTGQPH
jgi:class 3 adenylate cyclase